MGLGRGTYKSGSFWVSITAARGMPKLEAGPQKSVWENRWLDFGGSFLGGWLCFCVRAEGLRTYVLSRSSL